MKLCENRLEGFGPSSKISSPLPTSCFVDTILIPLPTWLYLLTLFLLIIFTTFYHHKHFNPSTAHLRLPHRSNHPCSLRNILHLLYYILIIANILMQTLEIVRLELIHAGISLLPFSYVGLGLGGFVHATDGLRGRIRWWVWGNMILWAGGVAVCVVQAIGLEKQGFHGVEGRVGSKYKISDQVIDVAVMAGVYAVIGLLEQALFWTRPKLKKEDDDLGDDIGEDMFVDERMNMRMK